MKTRLLTGIQGLLIAALVVQAARADGNYTMNGSAPYSYITLGGGAASALAGADDATITLNLPFAFRFYGLSYTSICVSSNGLVSFGGCVQNDFSNLDMTQSAPQPDLPLIAPYWCDLTFNAPGAGSLLYGTVGSPPHRQFVLQWNNAAVLNTAGTLNFEVLLGEDNSITLQYENVDLGGSQASKGGNAAIGIRTTGGQANGLRQQYSFQVPKLQNSQAISFTAPSTPAATNVTSKLRISPSTLVFNRTTGTWAGTISLTNTSGSTLAGPLTVQLSALPPNVSGLDATGTLPGVGPYYAVPNSGSLAPGATLKVTVRFNAPSNTRVTFSIAVYSGQY